VFFCRVGGAGGKRRKNATALLLDLREKEGGKGEETRTREKKQGSLSKAKSTLLSRPFLAGERRKKKKERRENEGEAYWERLRGVGPCRSSTLQEEGKRPLFDRFVLSTTEGEEKRKTPPLGGEGGAQGKGPSAFAGDLLYRQRRPTRPGEKRAWIENHLEIRGKKKKKKKKRRRKRDLKGGKRASRKGKTLVTSLRSLQNGGKRKKKRGATGLCGREKKPALLSKEADEGEGSLFANGGKKKRRRGWEKRPQTHRRREKFRRRGSNFRVASSITRNLGSKKKRTGNRLSPPSLSR